MGQPRLSVDVVQVLLSREQRVSSVTDRPFCTLSDGDAKSVASNIYGWQSSHAEGGGRRHIQHAPAAANGGMLRKGG